MSDVLLANKTVYEMVGNFAGSDQERQNEASESGCDFDVPSLTQLANSDLFVKKCLLPLESNSPEQVAEKMHLQATSL